nr:uncharacterized protein LOC127330856 [Lolium perenne]
MAKAQLVARLAVELASSSPLSSIIRQRRRHWIPRTKLDTIAEEENMALVHPHRNVTRGALSVQAGSDKGKRCAGSSGDGSSGGAVLGEKRLVPGPAPAKAGRSKVAT